MTLQERKLGFEIGKYKSGKEERAKRLKLAIDEESYKILLEQHLAEINLTLVNI